jgi:putative transposase
LANDQIYHIFNRGIERRDVFTNKYEFQRAVDTVGYYRFFNLPLKFSQFLNKPQQVRNDIFSDIEIGNEKIVSVIAFCLMPNHFHFLLKQLKENGISRFISNFTNSYTKYFNTKNERAGPLFQGIFKSVLIETNEQLLHLSRYIHLNPVSSFLIPDKDLQNYQWSSLPEYLNLNEKDICDRKIVLDQFSSIQKYKDFLLVQVKYAQELEKIKHLTID